MGLLFSTLSVASAQVYERDFVNRNYQFNHDLLKLSNGKYATLGIQYSGYGETYHSLDSTSHTILEVLSKNLTTDTIYREYGQGVYKCRFNSVVEHNDTIYVLTELALKNDSVQSTKNFGVAKVGPNGNYYPPVPLFSADSMVVYDIRKSHLSYRKGFFEFFGWRYDSIEHYYPVLIQFSRSGELLHYQAWRSDEPRITKLEYLSDYEYLGNGRYLLADEGERDTDTYFIADTSKMLLETSFFRNDIEMGYDIVKHDSTYYLFSTTGPLVNNNFKDHYAFWRMDSATEQMLSPIFYRNFDTVKYHVNVNPIIKEAALAFDDRLLFGSNMFYSERPSQNNQHLRWGINMIDTSGSLLWSWYEADSAKTYTSGVDRIIKLNQDYGAVLLGKTDKVTLNGHPWIFLFKFDGSTFSLEEQKAAGKPLEVFPNPVSGNEVISVRLPFLPDEDVAIKIFSTSGNLEQVYTHEEPTNLIRFKNSLKKGSYILQVKHRGYSESAKFLVE